MVASLRCAVGGHLRCPGNVGKCILESNETLQGFIAQKGHRSPLRYIIQEVVCARSSSIGSSRLSEKLAKAVEQLSPWPRVRCGHCTAHFFSVVKLREQAFQPCRPCQNHILLSTPPAKGLESRFTSWQTACSPMGTARLIFSMASGHFCGARPSQNVPGGRQSE